MKFLRPSALVLGSTVAVLAACGGGGGGDGGGGPMFIETCSLGCSSGSGGFQVSCSVVQVSLDTEIAIVFSAPVAPDSIDSRTFQLIDVGSGDVPTGTRFVDPTNPRRVVFRPAIIFNNDGTASFGFDPLRTYRITIPGLEQGDNGPFIRSTGGTANQSRMECDIQTTNTVDDLVPGPPSASVFVQLADTTTPDPDDFIDEQPAAGAVDVWRNSTIRFLFNDIMNPSTLANPVTQQSALITVRVDTDGVLNTTTDQVTLFGTYVASIDLNRLETEMIFTPANGMPSAGNLPPNDVTPRKVLITIPPGVQDLAGNPISNPGTIFFTPELIPYDPISIPDADGENFDDTETRDTANTGATWGGGQLSIGWGGGSGRLGALRVPTLQVLTLDVNGTLFKHLSAPDPVTTLPIVPTSGFLDNARPFEPPLPPDGYDPLDPASWPTVTVTNGVFEFSSIVVEAGGTIEFAGTTSGRLYSRGPATIDGTIRIAGETPAPHNSGTALGQAGGAGAVNAGSGGKGGDRPDNTNHFDILDLVPPNNGIENPGAVIDGATGGGVGNQGTLASGRGGRHHPDPFPTTTENFPAERGGLLYSVVPVDAFNAHCRIRQIASPGGGGAHATSGGRGIPRSPNLTAVNPNPPPATLPTLPSQTARGGDATLLGIEPPDPQSNHFVRRLEPQHLRGGSGGGGGGTHLYDTWQDGINANDTSCYDEDVFFTGISHYRDHSACGGGGGGGAVQVVSGDTMRVAGLITARGGDGGSSVDDPDEPRFERASPGGGGSGGSVRLQARILNLDANVTPTTGRIDVSGGLGGVNISPGNDGLPTTLGNGGIGGVGLIRLEDLSGGTNPPATTMTRCSESPKLLPRDPDHLNPNTTSGPCVGLPESESLLSVGAWSLPLNRPDSYSGATSCWFRPEGRFFTMQFDPDQPGPPAQFGWNMKVLYGTPPVPVNYRGPDPNSPFGSGDFETNLGSDVNYLDAATPPGNQFGTGPFDPAQGGVFLAVRFQGAVAISDISSDPCAVRLSGVGTQVAVGSLTPWVRHPAELNEFLPRPNMLRFCIVFDRAGAPPGSVAAQIQGLTDLVIHAQPD